MYDASFERFLFQLECFLLDDISAHFQIPDPDLYDTFIEQILKKRYVGKVDFLNDATSDVPHQTFEVTKQDIDASKAFDQYQNALQSYQSSIFDVPVPSFVQHCLLLSKTNENTQHLMHVDPALFEFTKSEFWLLKGALSDGSKLYNPRFEANLKGLLINEKIFSDDPIKNNTWNQSVINELNKLKHSGVTLRDNMRSILTTERQKQSVEIHNVLDQTESDLISFALEHLYSSTKEQQPAKKHKFLKLFAQPEMRKMAVEDRFIELVKPLNTLPFGRQHILNIEHNPNQQLSTRVLLALKQIEVMRNTSIERQSKTRVTIEDQIACDRLLKDFLHKVNGLAIFKQCFEHNAIDLEFKIDFLNQLLEIIDTAILQITHEASAYEWLRFKESKEPKVKAILEALRFYNIKEWDSMFELWYYRSALLRHMDGDFEQINNQFARIHTDVSGTFLSFSQIKFIIEDQEPTEVVPTVFIRSEEDLSVVTKNKIIVNHKTLKQIPSFLDASNEEKLEIAFHLYGVLSPMQDRIHVYTSKDTTFLFCIPDDQLAYILEELNQKRLKPFNLGDEFEEKMKELLFFNATTIQFVSSDLWTFQDLLVGQRKLFEYDLAKMGIDHVQIDATAWMSDPYYISKVFNVALD